MKKINGITPACAGKSASPLLPVRLRWDHPRVCGEKVTSSLSENSVMGSPPRVRGKVTEAVGNVLAIGITPACAGKS